MLLLFIENNFSILYISSEKRANYVYVKVE